MKQITAEQVDYIYYPYDIEQKDLSDILSALISYSILTEEIWHTVVKPEMEDNRIVKMRLSLHTPHLLVHFLHWDDGLDLVELDNRVSNDTYTDSDFENSLYTDFVGIECRKCKWRRYALAMDSASVYPGVPGLGKEKFNRRAERGKWVMDKCPECGTNLRRGLVKVFSTLPPPDAE